jgi:hypothetical protein
MKGCPRIRSGDAGATKGDAQSAIESTFERLRADFVVDTSHGLDPFRARIRDSMAEARSAVTVKPKERLIMKPISRSPFVASAPAPTGNLSTWRGNVPMSPLVTS